MSLHDLLPACIMLLSTHTHTRGWGGGGGGGGGRGMEITDVLMTVSMYDFISNVLCGGGGGGVFFFSSGIFCFALSVAFHSPILKKNIVLFSSSLFSHLLIVEYLFTCAFMSSFNEPFIYGFFKIV